MGNIFAKENEHEKSENRSFGQVMDYISTHYILTMDFQSLSKLYDKDYCDSLVVLTKDIILRNFNEREITYLAQRTQLGQVIDKETKEEVIFFNKNDLDKLDVSTSLKKKRICLGIAKFYVKIAHLFAAIVMTINPVYSYNDERGNLIKQPLANKASIPKNVDRKLEQTGLCSKRISVLKGTKQDWNKLSDTGDITLNPSLCGTNNGSSLQEESGIPELMQLYCDTASTSDNFQTTCDFNSMSERAKADYMRDLKNFYMAFTGKSESEVPPDLKTFSQIKMQDYKSTKGCSSENGKPFSKSYSGNIKDELFKKYAENLRNMIERANLTQEQLLDVINEMFTYDVVDDKKLIRINPTLTETSLQLLVEKTRKIIVDMYINCERDFEMGVKLYEAIVENQILVTTEAQLKELERVAQEKMEGNLGSPLLLRIPS